MISDAVCVAIVLSDLVIREQGSAKMSLINCFNNFNFPSFPSQTPRFFVTAFLTNFTGGCEVDLTVRIEEPKSGHVMTSISGKGKIEDGMQKDMVFEVPFPIMPFIFHEPGVFHVKLLVNNEHCGQRPVMVNATTTGSKQIE